MDQISSTVASVLGEYFKTSERTLFWDDDYRVNIDPFHSLEGGFFTADWDFKLKILRQLVELQLVHSVDIKSRIDRAWGQTHTKSKKRQSPSNVKDSSTTDTLQDLQFVPLGQDIERKRYWVVDDSPRIYVSTNPWKMSSVFQKISSTRNEYIAAVEMLKASSPPPPQGRAKGTLLQRSHLSLIAALESRIPLIDSEIARVQRVQRKIEQRKALMAQAELRETRTRRQARKPDYVYAADVDSEEDAEYTYQEDVDEEFDEDSNSMADDLPNGSRMKRGKASVPVRRSTRTAVVNANQKREIEEDPWKQWRGERRSSRLGAPPDTQFDDEPPPKRARTEESSVSAPSLSHEPNDNGLRLKATSAAALRPTEVALEQVAGKKKSKYWVYAVEPIPGQTGASLTNGHKLSESPGLNGRFIDKDDPYATPPEEDSDDGAGSAKMDVDECLSPLNSL